MFHTRCRCYKCVSILPVRKLYKWSILCFHGKTFTLFFEDGSHSRTTVEQQRNIKTLIWPLLYVAMLLSNLARLSIHEKGLVAIDHILGRLLCDSKVVLMVPSSSCTCGRRGSPCTLNPQRTGRVPGQVPQSVFSPVLWGEGVRR